MATEAKRGDALQFIFSLFLGVLLAVFVGVGVWTFYPQPFEQNSVEQRELDRLYREQSQLFDGKEAPVNNPEAERIQKRIDELNQQMQEKRDEWSRNTSIVLVAFATVLMAVSLTLPETMKVFSNGFLLGGMFTLIYGTGWSFAGGDSRARFYVVAVALLLSVGFGYLRFIRGRKEAAQAAAVAGGPAVGAVSGELDQGELSDISRRVAELERRAAAAAEALGASPDRD
jgi:Flp pilus assembly protein TadB